VTDFTIFTQMRLALLYIMHNEETGFCYIQSAHVTAALDLLAYSTNGEIVFVTNLHSTNFL
jgi:hypothetical protein